MIRLCERNNPLSDYPQDWGSDSSRFEHGTNLTNIEESARRDTPSLKLNKELSFLFRVVSAAKRPVGTGRRPQSLNIVELQYSRYIDI